MSDAPSDGVQSQKALDKQPAAQTEAEQLEQKAFSEYSKVEANGELSMRVQVHSPFKDYYDGQAFSISAENATGPFDILPKHHHFISLLSACEINIRTVNKGEQRIRISGGLMHVKSDSVTVFLDV
jgi:hypothetical protein